EGRDGWNKQRQRDRREIEPDAPTGRSTIRVGARSEAETQPQRGEQADHGQGRSPLTESPPEAETELEAPPGRPFEITRGRRDRPDLDGKRGHRHTSNHQSEDVPHRQLIPHGLAFAPRGCQATPRLDVDQWNSPRLGGYGIKSPPGRYARRILHHLPVQL